MITNILTVCHYSYNYIPLETHDNDKLQIKNYRSFLTFTL